MCYSHVLCCINILHSCFCFKHFTLLGINIRLPIIFLFSQRDKYQQQSGRWNLDTRRQNDQESRRASGLGSDGEIGRSDLVANDGAKALGVRKTAFTNGNLGFENIDYNFDKDFDQAANERGGYKEVCRLCIAGFSISARLIVICCRI